MYFIVVIGIRVNLICLFWVVFVISLIKFGCISIFVMVIVSDILVLNLMVVDVVIISGRKKKVLLLIIFRMVKVGDFFVSMLFILRIIVSSLIIDLLIIVGISGDMVLISVLRIFVLMWCSVSLGLFMGCVGCIFFGSRLMIFWKVCEMVLLIIIWYWLLLCIMLSMLGMVFNVGLLISVLFLIIKCNCVI